MKVGSQEWKRRYDVVSSSLGLDASEIGFGLNPVYEAFCFAELELFDESMNPLKRRHPRLEKFIEGLRGNVADPIYSYLILQNNFFPDLKAIYKAKKERLDVFDEALKGSLPSIIEQLKEQTRGMMLFNLDSIGSIIEEEKNLPVYFDFNCRLVRAVDNNYQNRLIRVPPRVVMANLDLRNEIYGSVLERNQEWLLWWNNQVFIRSLQQTILENSMKLEEYRKAISQYPEFEKIAAETDVLIDFPQPLGKESVPARKAYEQILPGQIPLAQINELESVVASHFNQRFASIKHRR